jgi:aryl-alcohol dehydrogenase-like predicted oxidoreductase
MTEVGDVELAPGYRVAKLIVGGWQLSAGHRLGAPGREDAVEHLVQLADLGFDTFDCADIYAGVEEVFGEFLTRWRTTSVGQRPIRVHTKLVPDLAALPGVDRRYVEGIVDRSLRRLRVDTLDLVQFYWWDLEAGSWLDAVGCLGDLQRAGKIRHVGATNFTAAEIDAMEREGGVTVVSDQVQYSALDHRPEATLTEYCSGTGTRLLCYGALAGGFLTGSWRGSPPPEGTAANRSLVKYRLIIEEFGGWHAYQALLEELTSIGLERGVDAATVALRYVLNRPAVAAVVVGFSAPERMRANLRAVDLELTDEDTARIRNHVRTAPGPHGEVYGLERNRHGPHGRIMRYDLNAK